MSSTKIRFLALSQRIKSNPVRTGVQWMPFVHMCTLDVIFAISHNYQPTELAKID